MKFLQSFITIKPRTISQPNRPVLYAEQVPSYRGYNQKIRNLNNVLRIRGPHSSNSDPLNFLRRKQSNLPNTKSVSSEEQKLIQKIEQLKTKQEKFEAQRQSQMEKLEKYRKRFDEEAQRGDKEMMNFYNLKQSYCVRLIQECGKMICQNEAKTIKLENNLQKLRPKKT